MFLYVFITVLDYSIDESTWRSVTLPGGVMSPVGKSPSFAWKDPPADCLRIKGKSVFNHFILLSNINVKKFKSKKDLNINYNLKCLQH
jgi:hypothetical protein